MLEEIKETNTLKLSDRHAQVCTFFWLASHSQHKNKLQVGERQGPGPIRQGHLMGQRSSVSAGGE